MLTKEAKQLLRRVKKHILEEPRRLNMDTLGCRVYSEDGPPCGTVACIAGWTAVLTKKQLPAQDDVDGWRELLCNAWEKATQKLGLSQEESQRLFAEPRFYGNKNYDYGENTWPTRFAVRYLKAERSETRARVTAERIEHFIATNGAE